MSAKIIKDPVHGYITLDEAFIRIVDSAEFQRLKYIEQGSFRVLYPAARHDRFIHSLGTYHLAVMFSENFLHNIKEDLGVNLTNIDTERLKNTFCYAALLHDIGHAPFSHTTEKFFEIKKSEKEEFSSFIEQCLLEALKDNVSDKEYERFESEYQDCGVSPHEIMSATILIRKAKTFLGDNCQNYDLELAARMVLGCTYEYNNSEELTEEEQLEIGIKNCFIRLLNSKTVDVDKVDYITRDTQMSGFLTYLLILNV